MDIQIKNERKRKILFEFVGGSVKKSNDSGLIIVIIVVERIETETDVAAV